MRSKPSFSFQDFSAGYPIAIETDTYRTSSLNELVSKSGWWEREVLIYARKTLGNMAANNFVNQRFVKRGDPSYMPEQFIIGAEQGVSAFFQLLSDHAKNPELSEDQDLGLVDILKPKLLAEFQKFHSSFKDIGLAYSIDLVSVANPKIDCHWFAFGTKKRASSTLFRTPIYASVDSMAHVRIDSASKTYYVREGIFEFALDEEQVNVKNGVFQPPTLEVRSIASREGHCIGVDVIFDVELQVRVTDPKDESKDWKKQIKRPMIFRFETDHFKGIYKGSWKIADVDNLLASRVFNVM